MRVRCGDPSILYRRLRSTASVSIASAGFLCGKILAKNCEQPKVTSKTRILERRRVPNELPVATK
jgi:hypothetical protein